MPQQTLEQTIQRAKLEILKDVQNGVIPEDAADFAALHEHVDANGYGGAFEDVYSVEDTDYWNAVQEALDTWIKGGGLGDPGPCLYCGTQCVSGGEGSVLCPNPKCSRGGGVRTPDTKGYHVTWEIDIDSADSPEDAARQAWAHMRRADSIANVFDVIEHDGAETVRVDLQEDGEVHHGPEQEKLRAV